MNIHCDVSPLGCNAPVGWMLIQWRHSLIGKDIHQPMAWLVSNFLVSSWSFLQTTPNNKTKNYKEKNICISKLAISPIDAIRSHWRWCPYYTVSIDERCPYQTVQAPVVRMGRVTFDWLIRWTDRKLAGIKSRALIMQYQNVECPYQTGYLSHTLNQTAITLIDLIKLKLDGNDC